MHDLWNFKMWGDHPGAEHLMTDNTKPPFTDYVEPAFDIEEFYSFFPEFKPKEGEESPTYTAEFVESMAKQAGFYIKPSWCRELDGPDRHFAYLLTVAHFAMLTKSETSKDAQSPVSGFSGVSGADAMPGFITSASVGGVSVSKNAVYQPKSAWEAFYYRTPYGRKFLMLLDNAVAAGLYYNGEENIANCLRW